MTHSKEFKLCVVFLCLLAACVLTLVIVQRFVPKEKLTVDTPDAGYESGEGTLYMNLKGFKWQNDAGASVPAFSDTGRPTVYLYWASWCPSCEEILPQVESIAAQAETAGADFVLVNRMEPQKETMENARKALESAGVMRESYYDMERVVYDALALTMIPTFFVADASGYVTCAFRGETPDSEALVSAIREAGRGKSRALADAIYALLLNEDGGIRSGYNTGDSDADIRVLSESQGLMLAYAASVGDAVTAGKLTEYINAHSISNLAGWYSSGEEVSPVNALIDDLRIMRGLALTGDESLQNRADAVYAYNSENGHLVDFYDFSTGEKAKRFTLCYADFAALNDIKKTDSRFGPLYDDALEKVKGGYISDSFPLYYSYYNYERSVYGMDDLNMAEALTTLLHLSQIGELKEKTLDWLRLKINEGQIWARYDVRGQSASNGLYESTAVYALVARIAVQEGDMALASRALEIMEAQKVRRADAAWDNAFGTDGGTGIYSFDQAMALMAYCDMEKVVGLN